MREYISQIHQFVISKFCVEFCLFIEQDSLDQHSIFNFKFGMNQFLLYFLIIIETEILRNIEYIPQCPLVDFEQIKRTIHVYNLWCI